MIITRFDNLMQYSGKGVLLIRNPFRKIFRNILNQLFYHAMIIIGFYDSKDYTMQSNSKLVPTQFVWNKLQF